MRPRLTEKQFLILDAIDRGHNYGLAIHRTTGIPRSGLTAHLNRLRQDGLIHDVGEQHGPQTRSRPRRVVELTPLGRRVLQAELTADAIYAASAKMATCHKVTSVKVQAARACGSFLPAGRYTIMIPSSYGFPEELTGEDLLCDDTIEVLWPRIADPSTQSDPADD